MSNYSVTGESEPVLFTEYSDRPSEFFISLKTLIEGNLLTSHGIQTPLIDWAEIEVSMTRKLNETGSPLYSVTLMSGHIWNVHLTKSVLGGEIGELTRSHDGGASSSILSPTGRSGSSLTINDLNKLRVVNGLPFMLEGQFDGQPQPFFVEVCPLTARRE